jgi:N-dimethylarginine dimethylaminohydrolase
VTVDRQVRVRTYLMCRPEYYAVEYTINPWMDTSVPVDARRAGAQWEALRQTLAGLGHTVHSLEPVAGLPDMVFAANGGFSVDGCVYGARFRYPQRSDEAGAHRSWYEGRPNRWRFVPPKEINEGEGDFVYLPEAYGGLILAGYGFRTEACAHYEAQEALGRPVISLRLVDPRFYHVDVVLASLDDANIVYYPGAFSPASQRVLWRLFPDAVLADESDALAFGINLVSDGRHVMFNAEAAGLGPKLAAAGYTPVPLDLAEFKKGGGGAKCCVAELRA